MESPLHLSGSEVDGDCVASPPESCPICRAERWLACYENVDGYRIDRCGGCGLCVTRPFPSDEELLRLYSENAYRSAGGRRFFPPLEWAIRYFRWHRLKLISRYRSPGRILDVGCGRGVMLELAQRAGWSCYGTEISEDTAREARRDTRIDIRAGQLHDAGFEPGFFDVISIWHVLEHVGDPGLMVDECRRLLRPDGLLVVSVPNRESWQSRWSGSRWFHLDVPHHLMHFSAGDMRRLLDESGFRRIAESHWSLEYGLSGMLFSLLNIVFPRKNALYESLKKNVIQGSSRAWLSVLGSLAALPLLLPLSAVLSGLESAAGHGGSVIFMARKGDS